MPFRYKILSSYCVMELYLAREIKEFNCLCVMSFSWLEKSKVLAFMFDSHEWTPRLKLFTQNSQPIAISNQIRNGEVLHSTLPSSS